MKKNLLRLSVWAATLLMASTLTSCVTETDEAPETIVKNGGLTINISTDDMNEATRAATDLTLTTEVASSREHTINTMVVAIFDGTAATLKYMTEIDMSAGAVADARNASFDMDASKVASGDKVAIAINAEDDDFSAANTVGTSTLEDFKGVTRTLDKSLAGTNTNDQLPMYGEGTVSGSSGLFTVNVTVYHLLSRISLNSVSTQFNYVGSVVASAQFTLTQVFLINVPEKFNYNIDATDGQYDAVGNFEANTTFYQGEAAAPDYGTIAGADRTSADPAGSDLHEATYGYKDLIGTSAITADPLFGTSTWGGTTTPTKRYLYTMPNAGQDAPKDFNDAGNQTCLVLKGTYKATDDATEETVYYAVNLHEYDATNKTVMPGKNYVVDAVIKGKGAENPYKALTESANLTANITITAFSDVTAGVTFGNGNITYNGTMPTETEPAIGDYLYADGTWSNTYDNTKTVVGIVYSVTPKTADSNARFTHGYAVAIKDASQAAAWSTEETDAGITNITWTGTGDTGRNNARTAITSLNDAWNNGRQNTAAIGTANANYPAFAALATFNTTYQVSGLHNSGWYLPAIGELYTMVDNLANASSQTINTSAWDESGGVAWGFYYQDPAADVVRAALNARLTVLKDAGVDADYFSGGKNYTTDGNGTANSTTAPNASQDVTGNESFTAASSVYYWSSSEWSSTHALYLNFNSNGNLGFGRSNAKSTATFRVRPVLAF
ncbi:MAG: hypothetical protein II949_05930 [Prevotella sp.]|nr:hypothetical protein [Prevotella sp.]